MRKANGTRGSRTNNYETNWTNSRNSRSISWSNPPSGNASLGLLQKVTPGPVTIGGIILGTTPGQFRAHKLKRSRRGVSFDWYTVDPNALLLPSLTSLASWSWHILGVAWNIYYRLIPDPSGIAQVNGCPVSEPIRQTSGGTEGTPTVAHKRKYKTSAAFTSLSTSSSGSSSSSSSSPTSNVNREDSIPGGRFMRRVPRRPQTAKRPRLDLTPPEGGGVTASSVQPQLAPPPVFRRRPPTPFNRPPGESGVCGDQGGGPGYVEGNGISEDEVEGTDDFSDDSLNMPPHRRRFRGE